MRLLVSILAAALLLLLQTGCGKTASPAPKEEIRAVWISYIDLSMENRAEKTEEGFRQKAQSMIRNLADKGFNTVFLHVRPFCDAIYPSKIYSFSRILTGIPGKDPGYDALSVFCTYADAQGISVHGWINPFRVCTPEELEQRPQTDPIRRLWKQAPSALYATDGTLYLDPAAQQTRRLILDGVRELLENYPLAGIHIDDYFYPDDDPQIDAAEYAEYLQNGGSLPLDDWRRNEINAFVSQLYDTIKCFGSEKICSISPAVNIRYDRDQLYADVERWGKYGGYCDWLIPQLYVGFQHENCPFEEMLRQWDAVVSASSVQLITGLAAYKCGQSDPYAGSGKNEWKENADILREQLRQSRHASKYIGFALFSYKNIFEEKSLDISLLELW